MDEIEGRWLLDKSQFTIEDGICKHISFGNSRHSHKMSQVYLSHQLDGLVTRIRCTDDKKYVMTTKGKRYSGKASETNIMLPKKDGKDVFNLHKECGYPYIDKTRYIIKFGKHTLEIDVFNSIDLAIVEIEFDKLDALDEFRSSIKLGQISGYHGFGKDITDDHSYSNFKLALSGIINE